MLTTEERFYRKTERADNGCLEWTAFVGPVSGYGYFHIDGHKRVAHRVAWFLAYGEWPELFVCHKCDNRKCVELSHLFLGTQKENLADMRAKGREVKKRGAEHWKSQLTEDDVRAIKKDLAAGMKAVDIAARYGLSFGAVSKIKTGRTWAWLKINS